MATFWDRIESESNDQTYSLAQTLSVSFLASASTLALTNICGYLLIFRGKRTVVSRLIIAFLATWWIGSSIDYSFDLLLVGRPLLHRIIEYCVVRAFYITSTELFNWSLYMLYATVCDNVAASLGVRRAFLSVLVFKAFFAVTNYCISVYQSTRPNGISDISPDLDSLFSSMYIAYYLLDVTVCTLQTLFFIYTHYYTRRRSILPASSGGSQSDSPAQRKRIASPTPSATDTPSNSSNSGIFSSTSLLNASRDALSSGLAFLAFSTIIHIFFACASVASHEALYDVRVGVLSASGRDTLWLLFAWRVRRAGGAVYMYKHPPALRPRGESALEAGYAMDDSTLTSPSASSHALHDAAAGVGLLNTPVRSGITPPRHIAVHDAAAGVGLLNTPARSGITPPRHMSVSHQSAGSRLSGRRTPAEPTWLYSPYEVHNTNQSTF